jgi:hypothetical protein
MPARGFGRRAAGPVDVCQRRRFLARLRPPRAIGLLIVLGLVVGATVSFLRLGARSTAVPYDVALGRYRAAHQALPPTLVPETLAPPQASPSPTSAPRPVAEAVPPPSPSSSGALEAPRLALPPSGVYRYATTGHERLSMPGARHKYPSETHLTVTHGGCGLTLRWQVLEERWDEAVQCRVPDGRVQDSFVSYREFYGYGKREVMICEPAPAFPPSREPGVEWSGVCEGDGTRMLSRSRLLGVEFRQVGTTSVRTLRVSTLRELRGASEGQIQVDEWYRTTDGLPVRMELVADVESDGPVGRVQYHEEYVIELAAAEPGQ